MKRAIILIVTLSLATTGCGLWLDHLQRSTAEGYLDQLEDVRALVLNGEMTGALREQRYMHALWQHDAHWLNCLISHHHTRDVSSAMLHLATALEQRWPQQAVLALDEARDALEEIAQSDLPVWENIL